MYFSHETCSVILQRWVLGETNSTCSSQKLCAGWNFRGVRVCRLRIHSSPLRNSQCKETVCACWDKTSITKFLTLTLVSLHVLKNPQTVNQQNPTIAIKHCCNNKRCGPVSYQLIEYFGGPGLSWCMRWNKAAPKSWSKNLYPGKYKESLQGKEEKVKGDVR